MSLRPLQLLRELQHENIVQAREIFLDHKERYLYLLLDYAEHDHWVGDQARVGGWSGIKACLP